MLKVEHKKAKAFGTKGAMVVPYEHRCNKEHAGRYEDPNERGQMVVFEGKILELFNHDKWSNFQNDMRAEAAKVRAKFAAVLEQETGLATETPGYEGQFFQLGKAMDTLVQRHEDAKGPISRKGWRSLPGSRISWKAGSDFRSAGGYLIARLDGKVVCVSWPHGFYTGRFDPYANMAKGFTPRATGVEDRWLEQMKEDADRVPWLVDDLSQVR